MIENPLVLGGGFIGRALARRLQERGSSVTVVSRSLPQAPLPGIQWSRGSLDDPALMRGLLAHSNVVVHAASTSTPGFQAHSPAIEVQENLLPLLRLLEMLKGRADMSLVFLSSGGAIYGNPVALPVAEGHDLAPLSHHAAGKAAAEKFLNVFAYQGHRVTILRPSNVYGPGQPLKPGFGVVRTMLDHIQHGTEMTIWGDGETVRDYLYIDDLVGACVAVLEQPRGGTFNVGSTQGLSLNALSELVESVTGRNLQRRFRPARGVDVRRVVLDCAAIEARCGWKAAVDIDEGVRRTWQWLEKKH